MNFNHLNTDSKKEFILLLKSGDESAFTELINKYNRRLFAYAISLSGDYSLAKDIVQDVFIKTFEYRKKLNPKFSIEGFLFRCVYNQFINTYHKNKSLLKVHDEYVRFLNQMIDETSNSEFDRLIKVVNEYQSLPGDINLDGVISILDMLKIIGYLIDNINLNENELTRADLNYDSSVDVFDLMLLSNIILDW